MSDPVVESMEVRVVLKLSDGTSREMYLPYVTEGGFSLRSNYLMIFGTVKAVPHVE